MRFCSLFGCGNTNGVDCGLCSVRGQYKLKNKIGTGAFGHVREAVKRKTKTRVAVKIILKSETCKADLENEVRLMRKLDHPNIVKCSEDFFEDKSFYYYAMELCRGGPLMELIDLDISEERASCYIRQILSGLAYLHKRNIIHRDIKPDNIVFSQESRDSDSVLKLVDFGLAVQLPAGKRVIKGDPCGTVNYIAPEACRGFHTLKGDIWAVGIIAHVFLLGCAPFKGACSREIMRATCSQPLKFSQSYCSEDAADFLKKCLTKNPNKRLSAAEALCHPWIVRNETKTINGTENCRISTTPT
eukprot:TRINITY_DN91422_c0_g2_i3.p1 TRINITY_DN91422_c0_g2~~TRINITY_DN91422_c0_g2_i3.p1  ORF type:complete len:301 (-),score=27.55 TRINITY_DN91422_c0_g2_i3:422-1324(-)